MVLGDILVILCGYMITKNNHVTLGYIPVNVQHLRAHDKCKSLPMVVPSFFKLARSSLKE